MFSPKLLYAVAIFLSSCLLFLIEPMAAKRLLPLLGGSAAVWTTCLVFFQTTLLLGYMSAHGFVTRLRPRAQVIAYTLLLAACLVQVIRSVNPDLHSRPEHPIVSVLSLLAILIGLPFLALSATGPLLQAWYSRDVAASPASANAQPYRLFALSNVGSLLALVVYPWLVERNFSLHAQGLGWSIGFFVLACVCVSIAFRIRRTSVENTRAGAADSSLESTPLIKDRFLWLLLPACASLLLSAVTNHLSENVAAIPLLWIVPLIAYLLSFVVAFNGERFKPRWLMFCLLALALGAIGYFLYDTDLGPSFQLSIIVFCVSLFLVCLFCHAELYRLRPAPRHMTSFYLLIAAGGALGAIFVGLAAPMIFIGNYELAYGLLFAAILGVLVALRENVFWTLFWCTATLAMAGIVYLQIKNDRADTMFQTRSFYGVLSVSQTIEEGGHITRRLYHGTIEHGSQIFTPELRAWPTTYYAHASGVGMAMDLCCGERPRRIGVIGLGTGTMAAYGRRGDVFRFYEINPLVERIAHTQFSYLRESRAAIEIVPGDARLSMAEEVPQRYDVIVVDAFSGDAIPVHLLTSQALELYRRHLQPNGILAFHVSNQFLDLAPEVQQQASHAGLHAVFLDNAEDQDHGEYSSDWVLVTANKDFLAQPVVAEAKPIIVPENLRLWTDDYNSLLPLLRKEPWLKDKDKDKNKDESQPTAESK